MFISKNIKNFTINNYPIIILIILIIILLLLLLYNKIKYGTFLIYISNKKTLDIDVLSDDDFIDNTKNDQINNVIVNNKNELDEDIEKEIKKEIEQKVDDTNHIIIDKKESPVDNYIVTYDLDDDAIEHQIESA